MKLYLRMTLLLTVTILLCSTIKKNPAKEPALTNHKWTLVEIIQKENDTLTNLTMFLTPCEKDNYVEFQKDGQYKIYEGPEKCSSSDIKGEGSWTFNPSESTITDSYQGGKKITKKVIILTDEILKIQYEGDGKKIYTNTYFSEEGKKDDANRDLIVDNSDASQNITQIIKNYLQSTNRHIIISRKDFQNATHSNIDDKTG